MCDTNCKDHLYTRCENEIVYDCACHSGGYIDEQRYCVPRNECGCYDFSDPTKYVKPNEETNIGCMKWYVTLEKL